VIYRSNKGYSPVLRTMRWLVQKDDDVRPPVRVFYTDEAGRERIEKAGVRCTQTYDENTAAPD